MHEEPQIQTCASEDYVGIPVTVTMATFASAADSGFPELFGWLGEHGIEPAAPPFIRYHVVDMDAELEIEFAAPVAKAAVGDGRVRPGVLPGGRYLTLLHTGPYDGLVAANAAVQDYALRHGIALESSEDGRRWRGRVERYLTNPAVEPDPAKWEVEVAYLISDDATG